MLELYCDSLCNTLKVSAELTLPLSRQGRVTPGWNKAASMQRPISGIEFGEKPAAPALGFFLTSNAVHILISNMK